MYRTQIPADSVSGRWAQREGTSLGNLGDSDMMHGLCTHYFEKTVLDSTQLSMCCRSREQSALSCGWSSQDGPLNAWVANYGQSPAPSDLRVRMTPDGLG